MSAIAMDDFKRWQTGKLEVDGVSVTVNLRKCRSSSCEHYVVQEFSDRPNERRQYCACCEGRCRNDVWRYPELARYPAENP